MTESSRYQKILLLSLGFFLLLVLMAVFHENGILNAYRLEQEQLKMKNENEILHIFAFYINRGIFMKFQAKNRKYYNIYTKNVIPKITSKTQWETYQNPGKRTWEVGTPPNFFKI